jgi:hypothetical protein
VTANFGVSFGFSFGVPANFPVDLSRPLFGFPLAFGARGLGFSPLLLFSTFCNAERIAFVSFVATVEFGFSFGFFLSVPANCPVDLSRPLFGLLGIPIFFTDWMGVFGAPSTSFLGSWIDFGCGSFGFSAVFGFSSFRFSFGFPAGCAVGLSMPILGCLGGAMSLHFLNAVNFQFVRKLNDALMIVALRLAGCANPCFGDRTSVRSRGCSAGFLQKFC